MSERMLFGAKMDVMLVSLYPTDVAEVHSCLWFHLPSAK